MYLKKNEKPVFFLKCAWVCLNMFCSRSPVPCCKCRLCLCGCMFVEVSYCRPRACNQLVSFLKHLLFLVFLKMNFSGIDLNMKCNTAESTNFLRHGKKLCCIFFPLKNKFLAVVGNVYRQWVFLGRTSKGNCCTFTLSFLCNSFHW